MQRDHRLKWKHKTIKLLKDNIEENPDGLGYVIAFLYNTKSTINERSNW